MGEEGWLRADGGAVTRGAGVQLLALLPEGVGRQTGRGVHAVSTRLVGGFDFAEDPKHGIVLQERKQEQVNVRRATSAEREAQIVTQIYSFERKPISLLFRPCSRNKSHALSQQTVRSVEEYLPV